MEYKEILGELSKKIYRPIYILQGDEPYYIDRLSNYIEANVLTEDEKVFNQQVVYGRDVTVDAVIAAAREFSFGATYRVVIVKEAQQIRNISDLEVYADNPLKSTILVICYKGKKIDGRSGLTKKVQKVGCVYTSEKIKEWELAKWIANYLKVQNLQSEIGVAELLAEYLGSDLQRIENEINKLKRAIPGLTKITKDNIEQNIGISKEYNVFEFVDALAKKDIEKVFRILKVFSQNPKENPPQMLIPQIFNYFKNLFLMFYLPGKTDTEIGSELGLNPYIVQKNYRPAMRVYPAGKLFRVIGYIREYDMKMKGVDSASGTDSMELMRELALKIIAR